MTPLQNALGLAAQGLRVFPLKPASKQPATANGHLTASADARAIRDWWGKRPNDNVGIALYPTHIALDIDPRNGGTATWAALVAELGEPPEPLCLQTSGRGDGGQHWIYVVGEAPGDGLRVPSTLGPGVDVKWKGYVVGAGSLHPDTGQPYTISWGTGLQSGRLNGPWADRVFKEKEAFTSREQREELNSDQWRELLSALQVIPAERRAIWLNVGMALHSTGYPDAYEAWNQWSARTTEDNYDEAANERAWAGFKS